MTRRSSKIKTEDIIIAKNSEKKSIRSVGRPSTSVKAAEKKIKKVTPKNDNPEKGTRIVRRVLKNKIVVKNIKSKPVIAKTALKQGKIENTANIEYGDAFEEAIAEKVIKKYINPRFNSLEIYEKQERKKILMMWLGVGVFMFFIAGYWIYDIGRVFKQSKLEYKSNNDFSFEKLSEATKDVSGGIDDFKRELEKTRSMLATTSVENYIAGSVATSSDLSNSSNTSTVTTTTGLIEGVITKEEAVLPEVPKPELIVKELQEKLIASSTENGRVRGVFEEKDIINE